jgi:isopenicillin-N N-acyltransferase like protein
MSTRHSAHRVFLLALATLLAYVPVTRAEDTVKVLAREGRGALLDINGARVCLLAGSPEEMGYQHGVLLREPVRNMAQKVMLLSRTADVVLKENPFAGSIEQAFRRTKKFTPERYLKELEGLAKGADLPLATVQATNIFPELFHCSGFALSGKATADGELLHGRVLDYMTEFGLQDNAVVFVCQPEGRNAFVNVGYAGFIGSVTGMNAKGVSFGEMGGRGEGAGTGCRWAISCGWGWKTPTRSMRPSRFSARRSAPANTTTSSPMATAGTPSAWPASRTNSP